MWSRWARLNSLRLKSSWGRGTRSRWTSGPWGAWFRKWQLVSRHSCRRRRRGCSRKYCSSTSHGRAGCRPSAKISSSACWPKTPPAGWAADSRAPRSSNAIRGSRKSTSANYTQGNCPHPKCPTRMNSRRTSTSNKTASTLKRKRVRPKMMSTSNTTQTGVKTSTMKTILKVNKRMDRMGTVLRIVTVTIEIFDIRGKIRWIKEVRTMLNSHI